MLLGDCVLFLTDLATLPCRDEQGINGMLGWWDSSALRIPRFPPAQLEKQGRAPVLIPGSPWQQWRWGTARGEGCQSSWMKEEGIGGDTSGNRRGGGLRKEDRRAYQTIFLFSDWVDDMEESGWFLVMAFFRGTALLFTQNRGIWLTFGPLLCSDKLYKCIPPQQTYHTQRGVLELVLLLTADSRVCVKAFVFNGEEVLVVVVTLAKISFGRISDTTEYMNSAACTGQPPVSQSFIWFQQRTELITH